MIAVNNFNSKELQWFNDPAVYNDIVDASGETEGSGAKYTISEDGNTLTLFPPAKKDFWARTFYEPLLVKNDASGLLCRVPEGVEATIKIDFEFTPVSQFDQAGILIYIDDNTWVKAGIEYCDGAAKMSTVVCNNGFSDWATQPWDGHAARLRIHKVNQSSSLVVEAAAHGSDDSSFQFIRIAHLSAATPGSAGTGTTAFAWRAGPFAACPTKQTGCKAIFTSFSVGPRESSVHDSAL